MALSMIRQGLLACRVTVPAARLMPTTVTVQKKRTLVTKQFKKHNPNKPIPWPYENTKFTVWDTPFDNPMERFDENTRIIVVDGNVGVGKTAVAKKIAEEFDMLLFPAANFDMKYVDDNGFDIRSIEHHMPEETRPYDIAKFYKNPHFIWAREIQYDMLALRYEQFLDAMAHLLNTGQGCVLEQSCYSDMVYMQAMHKAGYVDDYDLKIYRAMRNNLSFDFFLPHVVVYLDAPVDVLQKRIKQNAKPFEMGTSVLTPEYLGEIERSYKEDYLPSIEESVEVVTFDWSEIGDPMHVVEDLERLPIEKHMKDPYNKKFDFWKDRNAKFWNHYRILYTNEKHLLISACIEAVARLNHSYLELDPADIDEANAAYEKYYPYQHAAGFNPQFDKDYKFKIFSNYREQLRLNFYRTH